MVAVYPDGNPGQVPVDPTTPVGSFRTLYGDTEYTEYDPPAPGYGNFSELSDAEIEAFLVQGRDSVSRAIGIYYLALSGQAAKQSKSVADYDLKIDLTKRAGDLREAAQFWFALADEDDSVADEDAFCLVPTGKGPRRPAELTARWKTRC